MEPIDTVVLRIGPVQMTIDVSSEGEGDRAPASDVIRELAEDFRLFADVSLPSGEEIPFRVTLCCGPAPEQRLGVRAFKFRDASCFGLGANRTVVYDDGSVVQADHRAGVARIWAPDKTRLYEIAYLFTLSKVGEVLDSRGLHRVHALGISFPKVRRTGLFLMDAGVGKTTLALSLGRWLAPGALEFFSDEIPLTDGNFLFPFPIRVAMSEKTSKMFPHHLSAERGVRTFARKAYGRKFLVPLETLGAIAQTRCVDHIFICSRPRHGAEPSMRYASRWRVLLELGKSCVIGIGVPQMTEHLLRFDVPHLFKLAKIGCSRLSKSVHLALACEGHLLELVDDPEKNAKAIEAYFCGR